MRRIPPPPEPLRKRLAHSLSALVRGYPNQWSEDTTRDTWKPFYVELDQSTPLTPDTFRSCIDAPADRTIRLREFGEYFDYINDPDVGIDEDEKRTFALLRELMATFLTDATIVSVGENQLINTTTFIVGRLDDGSIVGIRANAVQT